MQLQFCDVVVVVVVDIVVVAVVVVVVVCISLSFLLSTTSHPPLSVFLSYVTGPGSF